MLRLSSRMLRFRLFAPPFIFFLICPFHHCATAATEPASEEKPATSETAENGDSKATEAEPAAPTTLQASGVAVPAESEKMDESVEAPKDIKAENAQDPTSVYQQCRQVMTHVKSEQPSTSVRIPLLRRS